MANSHGIRDGFGMTFQQTRRSRGIIDIDLVVPALGVDHYEFSFGGIFQQMPYLALVDRPTARCDAAFPIRGGICRSHYSVIDRHDHLRPFFNLKVLKRLEHALNEPGFNCTDHDSVCSTGDSNPA